MAMTLWRLGRNLGEVFGVFGLFQPKKDGLFINFLNNNSANFDGLSDLEDRIKEIGPPKWPWAINSDLATQGKTIYERHTEQGGCVDCHGITTGKFRSLLQKTWATPIQNVGTDTRQYDILSRKNVNTGALQGAYIPGSAPLMSTDTAFNILKTSVIGSIIDHLLNIGGEASVAASPVPGAAAKLAFAPAHMNRTLPPALQELQSEFHSPTAIAASPENNQLKLQLQPSVQSQIQPQGQTWTTTTSPPQKGYYEARVLQGIWAAAPYLHNGSVPTLAELLKPAAERIKSFKIGPAYDTNNIGLAVEQTQFNAELATTDCSNLNSANSRCGHEFGTQLTPDEKKALLEYLKAL